MHDLGERRPALGECAGKLRRVAGERLNSAQPGRSSSLPFFTPPIPSDPPWSSSVRYWRVSASSVERNSSGLTFACVRDSGISESSG